MRNLFRSFNVPNTLTFLRLAATPFVMLLFAGGRPVAAAALFVAASLTDCVDGWLARRLGQCTRLGLYLDPAVDKIVILALFYELAAAGWAPMAAVHLFLARELLQSAVRSTAGAQGLVVGANWMGKTKASLQTVLVAWGLLAPAFTEWLTPDDAIVLRFAFQASVWAVLVLSWIFFAIFIYWNRALFVGASNRTV